MNGKMKLAGLALNTECGGACSPEQDRAAEAGSTPAPCPSRETKTNRNTASAQYGPTQKRVRAFDLCAGRGSTSGPGGN